jgi:hypothetical protein
MQIYLWLLVDSIRCGDGFGFVLGDFNGTSGFGGVFAIRRGTSFSGTSSLLIMRADLESARISRLGFLWP